MNFLDKNGVLYLWQQIKAKLDAKVDKVDGKVLSANDLTNALKSNYDKAYTHSQSAHAPSNAQVNVIETVKVNGTALTPTSKVVNIDISGKVDKVEGKDLSTNDYTTAEKTKLAGIADGANKTVINDTLTSTSKTEALSANQGKTLDGKIENVKKSLSSLGYGDMLKSTYDTDGDGVVDNSAKLGGQLPAYYAKATDIPTKTSQLTNDSSFTTMKAVEEKGYQTSSQVNSIVTGKGYQTASQVTSAINTAIAGVTQFDLQIVTELPTTGKKGVIYLIAHAHGTNDSYDEYIWVTKGSTNKFEKIGNTDIDLSAYLKKTDIVAITNAEIDTILAS